MNDPNQTTEFDLPALLQEQRRRWERGTPTPVEQLFEQHPSLRGQKDALLDLINHEIVLRGEFETPPTRDEYLRRFPDLQTDLMKLFEVHDAIEADSKDEYATVSDPTLSTAPLSDWPALPNYELIEVLGQGGMGIVYKAIDRRLKRAVALKMIRGGRVGTEERRRFQIEAEAVAKLDHPGIVHIYEVGEYDKEPFFALEYVDGGSLSGHLNGVPQPPLAAAHLIESLARSVHHAHGLGIIHRDLKPANILLHKVGDSPSQVGTSANWVHDGVAYQPKIADFGLAKQVESNSDATQTQAIVGTPSYMAPEQAGDYARRIGPTADVYSLGAILYEMLTGRPPFRGQTVFDTLDQVRTQDPIPPTRLQPKVPRDLETICLKCLRKDAADRYANAEALADDLTRFLRREPILARPTSTLEHFRLWCRRRPAVAILSASVILAVLVGSVTVLYFSFWALAEQTRAQERESQRNAQLYDVKIKLAYRDWRENRIEHLQAALDALRPKPGEPDLRDFEWHYLAGLVHQSLANVPATACVAFSPDGAWLAAGAKQEIHLWKSADLEKPDPQPVAKLQGHVGDVVSLAFNARADRLLSAARDRTVRIWDVAQKKTIGTLPAHPADVTAVAFNPADDSMATACRDGLVRIWEPDGSKRLDLDEHTGAVNDIAFSADGKRLASASFDKSVIIWDVATGIALHNLIGHTGEVKSVAWQGRRFASGGFDGSIRLWDADKGELLHAFPPITPIQSLAFRPDGKRLAAACVDRPIQLWDIDFDAPRKKLPEEPALLIRGHSRVDALAFSPAGDRLASVGRDGMMRLWNPNREQESQVFNLPTPCGGLALCPTRPILALVGSDKNVHLWNWHTGDHKALSGHADIPVGVAFTGDGTLASASKDGKLRVWNIEQEKMLREFAGNGQPTQALEFHPGGHRLVSGGQDGTVQFWEAAGGRMLYQGPRHQGAVNDLAFSPDGKLLASAGADGMIFLCDTVTGKEVRRLHDAGRTPYALAFSADGQFLAAGDKEFTIRVWNAHTGQQIHLFEGHEGSVQAVAFSYSGRRLASGGGTGDGTIKLWDLTTGLELLTLRGHGREVSSLIFAPNDEALLSLGRTPKPQGQLRVWSAAGRGP